MKFRFFALKVCCLFFASFVCATPPRIVPEELLEAYTWKGEIPVWYGYYFDNSYSPLEPLIYTQEVVNQYILDALRKVTKYYGATDTYLYEAIDETIGSFRGKSVGVLGSVTPWYESIVIAYGGRPVTIDYNSIQSLHPRLTTLTVQEYDQNPTQFDYLFSISSFEHDGLGRYGDPLNPTGDKEAMEKAKKMLKPGGLLFLAVPVGKDAIIWNAHRVYGENRLPFLLEGWEVVATVGFQEADFQKHSYYGMHQPLFVLRPVED